MLSLPSRETHSPTIPNPPSPKCVALCHLPSSKSGFPWKDAKNSSFNRFWRSRDCHSLRPLKPRVHSSVRFLVLGSVYSGAAYLSAIIASVCTMDTVDQFRHCRRPYDTRKAADRLIPRLLRMPQSTRHSPIPPHDPTHTSRQVRDIDDIWLDSTICIARTSRECPPD